MTAQGTLTYGWNPQVWWENSNGTRIGDPTGINASAGETVRLVFNDSGHAPGTIVKYKIYDYYGGNLIKEVWGGYNMATWTIGDNEISSYDFVVFKVNNGWNGLGNIFTSPNLGIGPTSPSSGIGTSINLGNLNIPRDR